ncbi:response regulator [Thermaurantiacus tibetensis]|uniref:response regulator n=1 Tax=Thermaurantiacus tibetensis TaxID=2759035 RepID=UPI001890809C|nr:response regulator [Thermaurantiacus tibetensis]
MDQVMATAATERAPRILVVDDDVGIRSLVSTYLSREGYAVEVAGDAAAMDRALAEATAAGEPFDLVVLDLMLPGEPGQEALKRMAPNALAPAVVVLSALGDVADRIEGLELGADDYLAKPCNPRELLARIRAVLRRRAARGAGAGTVVGFRGWTLDLVRRELRTPSGVLINLADSEFLLLKHFVEHPGETLSRETLLALAGSAEAGGRAIDVQVSRLRRKLSVEGELAEDLIRTVRNGGYMFTGRPVWG